MREDITFEVADIFRLFGYQLGNLSKEVFKVVNALTRCRTEEAGGHMLKCDTCDNVEISYNSCRNRHCPKCQFMKSEQWIADRERELLQTEYFHVVFTIPACLHPILMHNPKEGYGLLFQAVAKTLKKVAKDPKHLGASMIGFFGILHTWTQRLLYHPHIHCVVAGGGLSADNSSWIPAKKNHLLPVRVISKVFRGIFLKQLERAYKRGLFSFHGKQSGLKIFSRFKSLLVKAARKEWVVHSKKTFAKPEYAIQYLSRYTHRVAISNLRLRSFSNENVSFYWQDRSDSNKTKVETISICAFMKRFLLHILPSGFVKIRFYGFMGHGVKKKLLPLCRRLISGCDDTESEEHCDRVEESWLERYERITGRDLTKCAHCEKGTLFLFGPFPGISKGPPRTQSA